ncbi:MAG TPA: hypothetical protein DCF78_12005, partial [Dehalococcoidia bacterium]|nr:hypothetical protein [Dehalococcoidia bacterium]
MLNRRRFLGLFAILALLGAACSSQIQGGTGTLPSGIDSAMVPDAELGGYIYFSSDPPIAVSNERFLIPSEAADLPPRATGKLQLSRATIAISEAPKDFSGTLEFANVGEAQTAWDLYQSRPESADFSGVLDAPKVHIVHGESPWALDVRAQVDSGNMVSIEDSDPLAWDLLTNLPESTEKPPLAVGALTLGGDML